MLDKRDHGFIDVVGCNLGELIFIGRIEEGLNNVF